MALHLFLKSLFFPFVFWELSCDLVSLIMFYANALAVVELKHWTSQIGLGFSLIDPRKGTE